MCPILTHFWNVDLIGSPLWPNSWKKLNRTSRPAGVALIPTSLSEPTGCLVDKQQMRVAPQREDAAAVTAAAFLCCFLQDGVTAAVSGSEQRARPLQRDVFREVLPWVFSSDWALPRLIDLPEDASTSSVTEEEAPAWFSCQLSASSQLRSFTFPAGDKTFLSVLPMAVVKPRGNIYFTSTQCLVSNGSLEINAFSRVERRPGPTGTAHPEWF